jgi:hypothetical protein
MCLAAQQVLQTAGFGMGTGYLTGTAYVCCLAPWQGRTGVSQLILTLQDEVVVYCVTTPHMQLHVLPVIAKWGPSLDATS